MLCIAVVTKKLQKVCNLEWYVSLESDEPTLKSVNRSARKTPTSAKLVNSLYNYATGFTKSDIDSPNFITLISKSGIATAKFATSVYKNNVVSANFVTVISTSNIATTKFKHLVSKHAIDTNTNCVAPFWIGAKFYKRKMGFAKF